MLVSMLPLQTLSAPIVAAILGALLGSLLTLLIQLYLRYRRRNDNRRDLRLALGAELADLGDALRWADTADMTRPERNTFLASLPTTVYETWSSDIGLLSEEELTTVIGFYDSLKATGAISKTELSEDFDDEFELEYTPTDLLVRHRAAVAALWPNLRESDLEALGLKRPEEQETDKSNSDGPTESTFDGQGPELVESENTDTEGEPEAPDPKGTSEAPDSGNDKLGEPDRETDAVIDSDNEQGPEG